MLVKVHSAGVYGIEAQKISIECGISAGIRYYLVGLPDISIKESWQRIESALVFSGFRMPRQKIVINLAPAYLRKGGSAFDLAIALAILAASKQLDPDRLTGYIFLGELSLDGKLRQIRGALPIAKMASKEGFDAVILPKANGREAAIIEGVKVFAAENLKEAVAILQGNNSEPALSPIVLPTIHNKRQGSAKIIRDFVNIRGQITVKRGLEIAAAGGHNLLLIGPPGGGKSLLAGAIPTILPSLSTEQALQTTQIYSAAGLLNKGDQIILEPPFRNPHHSITTSAFIGGGHMPQPGEVAFAHNGVLFMDELPEFRRSVLEALRQPLEEHQVSISRSRTRYDFPSDFMFVAAMNACPCGFLNHPTRNCACGTQQVRQYLSKISGPLLDRIDMHIEVLPVSFDDLSQDRNAESSDIIASRVERVRQLQVKRFDKRTNQSLNSRMSFNEIREYCRLDQDGNNLMREAMKQLQLSARAYERILKVARTIADLDGASEISVRQIAEALQYRYLDRVEWLG